MAHVKRELFEGMLRPGDFFGSESGVVAEFKVGRRTAREAIQALQGLGIFDVRSGVKGGAWIAEGHPDRFAEALAVQLKLVGVDLAHILETQHMLETTSARLAAERRTEEDVEELRSIVREGAALIGSQQAFRENGLAFHFGIIKSSHNPLIGYLFRALRLVIWRDDLQLSMSMRKRVQATHERIFNLIEKGAADKVADLMSKHVNEVAIKHSEIKPKRPKRKKKAA